LPTKIPSFPVDFKSCLKVEGSLEGMKQIIWRAVHNS
jgi:hypothetical protein